MASRIIRPKMSIDGNEDNHQLSSNNSFSELCENGIIKPGMMAHISNKTTKVNISYIDSGFEHDYDVVTSKGIVVEKAQLECQGNYLIL